MNETTGTYFDPYYVEVGAKQGWECPKCGHVYSPSVAMCIQCPTITYTTTTTGDEVK